MESYTAIGLARRSELSGVVCDWLLLRRQTDPGCPLCDKIRRHYQRVVYEKRMASIEAMVKAKVSILYCSPAETLSYYYTRRQGDLSVNIDARACFLPVSFFADPSVVNHDIWSRAKRVRVGGMGLKHTFEVCLSSWSF